MSKHAVAMQKNGAEMKAHEAATPKTETATQMDSVISGAKRVRRRRQNSSRRAAATGRNGNQSQARFLPEMQHYNYGYHD